MAKKRVTIHAKGEVQKVGYRDFAQKVARKLGIVGYVENMRDGSVQIVCEGEESAIEEFSKSIKVKVKFIDVEEVNIIETGEPTGEFEYFDIKRGDMAEELGERLDVSILYLDATKEELKDEMKTGFCAVKEEVRASRQDIRDVGQKVDVAGQKVEGVGKDVRIVGEKINNLTISTKENFNELGEKYHVISEAALSIQQELVDLRKKNTQLLEAITLLVKDHVDRDKQ